ncbi:DeoR/GlpR family DNA-binding transcription regulator [Sinomonas sp. ASV486]|uniref:DeoR/GlpR family DNA-binding transcription regulator n=1 Tax=Sinomonas sp. ASV486 TaxID=3051170 RepID=UPI0027DE03DF|nr:DeoR/GlpR family DNA-binding transcription regulator [Sinomonas sp. ASV486]MDQ4488892.1 DeoR/GlpR family DNA-binding transcription regulator [Sinomonas sp. ASV486]
MLAAARQSAILGAVQREGVVKVADLAHRLGVSAVTIRRDIESLSDAGQLTRVHGGVMVPSEGGTHEPGFALKSTQNLEAKEAIAREAASLVTEDMAVGITAGSTTWVLAKALAAGPRITVLTNSVRVMEAFSTSSSGSTVLLTGGQRTPSDALVGPLATASVRRLHLDILFLGVHGIDERAGFTTPNLLEAETNEAFASAARRVVVVADHSKWGVQGIGSICALDEVDCLVTDREMPATAVGILNERIPSVRLAQ